MRLPIPPLRQKKMEATPGFEPGMKDLQSSALPLGYVAIKKWSGRRDSNSRPSPWQGDALPLSHFRMIWCRDPELNWGHEDFQSSALPTELSRRFLAEPTGLEPAISGLTGRHVNRTTPRLHLFFKYTQNKIKSQRFFIKRRSKKRAIFSVSSRQNSGIVVSPKCPRTSSASSLG